MKNLGLLITVLALSACGFQPAPNCRGGNCWPNPQPSPCGCSQEAPAAAPCGCQQAPEPQPMPLPAPCPCNQQQVVFDNQYQPMPMQPVAEPAPIPAQQSPNRNIIVRDRTPYSVTYEFYNVRLDELVKYAKEYCGYINMTPLLRESLTGRNNSRVATFDCVNPNDLK